MRLNDKVYDAIKYIVIIVLPAIATGYAAVAKIWGLPYITEIVGTIGAIETFLGAALCISTAEYNKTK